jgi:hypothetical protein
VFESIFLPLVLTMVSGMEPPEDSPAKTGIDRTDTTSSTATSAASPESNLESHWNSSSSSLLDSIASPSEEAGEFRESLCRELSAADLRAVNDRWCEVRCQHEANQDARSVHVSRENADGSCNECTDLFLRSYKPPSSSPANAAAHFHSSLFQHPHPYGFSTEPNVGLGIHDLGYEQHVAEPYSMPSSKVEAKALASKQRSTSNLSRIPGLTRKNVLCRDNGSKDMHGADSISHRNRSGAAEQLAVPTARQQSDDQSTIEPLHPHPPAPQAKHASRTSSLATPDAINTSSLVVGVGAGFSGSGETYVSEAGPKVSRNSTWSFPALDSLPAVALVPTKLRSVRSETWPLQKISGDVVYQGKDLHQIGVTVPVLATGGETWLDDALVRSDLEVDSLVAGFSGFSIHDVAQGGKEGHVGSASENAATHREQYDVHLPEHSISPALVSEDTSSWEYILSKSPSLDTSTRETPRTIPNSIALGINTCAGSDRTSAYTDSSYLQPNEGLSYNLGGGCKSASHRDSSSIGDGDDGNEVTSAGVPTASNLSSIPYFDCPLRKHNPGGNRCTLKDGYPDVSRVK